MTVAQTAPLAGITVLDLSRVLAGPYCTMVIADLGARVIKIEHPDGGDDSRAYGPFVNGVSAYFMSVNRGKESIALDLKSAADRAIFERMISQADVLVENFLPGTMQKLGYGWPDCTGSIPRLSTPRPRASGTPARTAAGQPMTWSFRRWAASCR